MAQFTSFCKWCSSPEKNKLNIARQFENLGDLKVTTNENILVIDNGCDQTIINTNSCLIYTFFGIKYKINGALSKISSSSLELVSDAYNIGNIDKNKNIFLK